MRSPARPAFALRPPRRSVPTRAGVPVAAAPVFRWCWRARRRSFPPRARRSVPACDNAARAAAVGSRFLPSLRQPRRARCAQLCTATPASIDKLKIPHCPLNGPWGPREMELAHPLKWGIGTGAAGSCRRTAQRGTRPEQTNENKHHTGFSGPGTHGNGSGQAVGGGNGTRAARSSQRTAQSGACATQSNANNGFFDLADPPRVHLGST